MRSALKVILIISLFTTLSCSSSPVVDFAQVNSLNNGDSAAISGYFDLKSICLNPKVDKKVLESYCFGYFSSSLDTSAPAIQIELPICKNGRRTSCIEELPESAPPEVIKIRDNWGMQIGSKSKTTVKATAKSVGKKRVFEIISIH